MVISRQKRISLCAMKLRALRSKIKPRANREVQELPMVFLPRKLEWLLLGSTGLTMLLVGPVLAKPEFIWLTLLNIGVLVLTKLRDSDTRASKIFHTLLELIVLILPSLTNSGLPFFPLLGLVVVIRSCERFERLGHFIVSGLTFSIFTVTQMLRPTSLPAVVLKTTEQASRNALNSFDLTVLMMKFNAVLAFGVALLFVMLLINALLEERKSRAKLVVAHEQLQQYSLRIEDQSALQERNRIAREIHDALGHTLTAQSIQLDSASLLLKSHDFEQAATFLTEAKQLCKQALHEVRQSVSTLRNYSVQHKSLEAVVRELSREFHATTTIAPAIHQSVNGSVPPEVISVLYRILQEALTNITRHSIATEVTIQIFTQNLILHLLVQDNGKGFDPDQNQTGFGLQGMRERTIALGGKFSLGSRPGAGCCVTVQIPLARPMLS
jgi:signal transduction histidine kinase